MKIKMNNFRVFEWLMQSNFIDRNDNATDAGLSLHDIFNTSQTP